jgi:hypothetical protein
MNCQPPEIIITYKNIPGEFGKEFCWVRRGRLVLYSLIALIFWDVRANNFGMTI